MNSNRLLGLVLVALGVTLLFFGLRATDSVAEKLTEGLTGKYTDQTLWFVIGGAVSAIAGVSLLTFGARSRTA